MTKVANEVNNLKLKKTLLKLVSLGLALLLAIIPMASCGGKKPVKQKVDHVYRIEEIALPTKFDSINNLVVTDSGYGCLGSVVKNRETWEESQRFVHFDNDGNVIADIELPSPGYSEYSSSYITSVMIADNGLWCLENSYSYDPETNESSSDYNLLQIDSSGKITKTVNLAEFLGEDFYSYISRAMYIDGRIYICSGQDGMVLIYDPVEGKLVDKIVPENLSSGDMVAFVDGNPVYMYYDETIWQQHLGIYDKQTGKIKEVENIPSVVQNNIYNITAGGEYDFYISSNNVVVGYNIGSEDVTELLSWVNSDINVFNVMSYGALADGTFIALLTEDNGPMLCRLHPVPEEQVAAKYIMTLANIESYNDYAISNIINKFNRASEEYRIVIKDYSVYNIDDPVAAPAYGYAVEARSENGAYSRLNSDIAAGDIPDIIPINDYIPYTSYASKGVFLDLNKLIDKDENFNRADYFDNVLRAGEIDGHLYSLIPQFTIATIAVRESWAGGRRGLSVADFIRIIKEHPDARAFIEIGRESFIRNCISTGLANFIDFDTGKCSFNSEAFMQLLELATMIPEKSFYEENSESYDDSVWMAVETAYRDGKAIFSSNSIYNQVQYWQMLAATFNKDMALVGFPSAETSSSVISPSMEIAISSRCKTPEGAWQFLSLLLSEEYQDEVYNIPLRRSSHEKTLARMADPKDDQYYWSSIYYLAGQEQNIGRITKEESDYLTSFIGSLDRVRRPDFNITVIITEELSYFYDGVKSASEIATIIQSRVQNYVDESM